VTEWEKRSKILKKLKTSNDTVEATQNKMACSACKDILIDYKGPPHTEATCPFGTSLICLYCKESGHTINSCATQRLYLPVKIEAKFQPPSKERIDIVNDDRVIGAFLTAHSIQRSQKPKKNLALLDEYAKKHNLEVHKYQT
jgi:hypothetical protein